MACHKKLHYRKNLLSLSLFFASGAFIYLLIYDCTLYHRIKTSIDFFCLSKIKSQISYSIIRDFISY